MKALAILAVVILTGCGGTAAGTPADAGPEPARTFAPAAAPVTPTARGGAFPGGKYSPAVQSRIDELATSRNCSALQVEFDTADRNDAATRSRTGSGTADLMAYIDAKMRVAGCYG